MSAIRRLTPADAAAYQALRLEGLREAPAAFASSYEEERELPMSLVEARLAEAPDRGTFGAFEEAKLVGIATLGRESHRKTAHKAHVWGLYVAPAARRKGVGRALLQRALALARSVPQIRQVNVSVNAANRPALLLYRSCGFQEFGLEADALLVDGRLHDELHLCLRLAHD